MFAENLSVFLADFGVPCSANSVNFVGVLDMPSELIGLGHGDVVSNAYTLLVQTTDGQAAGLASGVAVTANGVVYVVRERLLEDDGAFTRFTLRK
jgi:hypothetical protein